MKRQLLAFLLLLFSSFTDAAPVPVFCPDQILCPTNQFTNCAAQGQFASYWGAPKKAGTSISKGSYTFDSAWVKYEKGYAVENICYYIHPYGTDKLYVSVYNKPGTTYYVSVPLSGSWVIASDKTQVVKCESSNIFQCPLVMNAHK